MARKRYSDEDILKLLREIELNLAAGNDVVSACRSVGRDQRCDILQQALTADSLVQLIQ
jgi:hypothetical protein